MRTLELHVLSSGQRTGLTARGEQNVVSLPSRHVNIVLQRHDAFQKGPHCSRIIARAARGGAEASGGNGATGGEALLELADRQASSRTAGPSSSTSLRDTVVPIRQPDIPGGSPHLATLVRHPTIPACHAPTILCTFDITSSPHALNEHTALAASSQHVHSTWGLVLQMVKCPDRKGVIAALAQLLYGLGCNILASEQFTAAEGVYFQRIRFDLSDIVVGTANVSVLERAIAEVGFCITLSLPCF